MGPIRREQICRAAAKVIAQEGFAGTTMRVVADEAGVSTGMLNHYFANRMEMLEATLVFVSQRQQAQEAKAIEGVKPGEERLRRLVRAVLPTDRETMQAWRVWIAAHGESVHLPELRKVMAHRNDLWYEIMATALEDIVSPDRDEALPFALQLDALMNGLILQAITTEANIDFGDIEDAVVAAAQAHATAAGSTGTSRSKRRRAA
jgi:AcrR family transcriptional regulator